MASGDLYTFPENPRAYKVLIAAQHSGASVRVVSDFQFGKSNKTKEFLDKFPLGKVPAFEGKDGLKLFESNAIAHYVGNSQLRGSTPQAEAEVLQWINFADNEILPSACTWVFPCLGIIQYNKQDTEKAKEQVKKVLEVLNNTLLTRTYLVGERVTQADITVACNLLMLYQHVLDPEFRKPYMNVNRWFTTLLNQKEFKAVIKNFQMCEKMAQFDAKKFAELHGKTGGGKKEGKKEPKKEQPKKEQPKKAEKKPKDDEEEDVPKAVESKDPFEQFPRGTFNMDEFKRTYSNNDTLTVALPYFFEKFDKENYSVWYCEYTEDLSKNLVFMTCNLVGGFFQRIEKMRKNTFASMCIFGEDKKTAISGIWIWRGHELAFKLCEDWQIDYESYSWRKLDFDAPETKTLIKEHFAWEGDFGGKKFNQGKIYK